MGDAMGAMPGAGNTPGMGVKSGGLVVKGQERAGVKTKGEKLMNPKPKKGFKEAGPKAGLIGEKKGGLVTKKKKR